MLKGFWKMLSGQGEQEYREQHQKFRDAIPDSYPADMTIEERAAIHPAYSGPLEGTRDAANYRRAHWGGRGPQSKAEHGTFWTRQKLQEKYDEEVAKHGVYEGIISFRQWLDENGIPLGGD